MYDALFLITQYPSGNPYLVNNLFPISLGWTFVPFARNITGPFTPAALPTRSTVIENLESLQFLSWRGLSLPPTTYSNWEGGYPQGTKLYIKTRFFGINKGWKQEKIISRNLKISFTANNYVLRVNNFYGIKYEPARCR